MNMSVKKTASLAVFLTVALGIYAIESFIPLPVPLPGVKLGLSNIVTLFLIRRFGIKEAAMVMAARILIASLFFGGVVTFIYSVFGGVLSLVLMGAVNSLLSGKYLFITGIFGAMAHNLGQVLAAVAVLKSAAVMVYLPFLLIVAVFTGLFTGTAAHFAEKKLPKNGDF